MRGVANKKNMTTPVPDCSRKRVACKDECRSAIDPGKWLLALSSHPPILYQLMTPARGPGLHSAELVAGRTDREWGGTCVRYDVGPKTRPTRFLKAVVVTSGIAAYLSSSVADKK